MDIDELKTVITMVDPADLEDAAVGEIYEIEGVPFKVVTVKPMDVERGRFAVELATEEGYTFQFKPVRVNDWSAPAAKTLEELAKPKERKNRNKQKYIEIYEKSHTTSSYDLAKEYGMSYAMIRYVIRKMREADKD